MRTLAELLDQNDPALPLLRDWVNDPAGNSGLLLPPGETVRSDSLLRLQITTRSMLGAVVYETGGVSVADGFIRLLGSGSKRSLLETTRIAGCPLDGSYPDFLIVGDDVLGGLFALNGGRFGAGSQGEIFHLAADDTVWVTLGTGYADFVAWSLTSDLKRLYGPLADLSEFAVRPRPAFDATYSFYPFLWTKEAKAQRPDVWVVSAEESLRLRFDFSGFAVD